MNHKLQRRSQEPDLRNNWTRSTCSLTKANHFLPFSAIPAITGATITCVERDLDIPLTAILRTLQSVFVDQQPADEEISVAKSLQEQLRQAGIASQKQMVKGRKAQNTKEKMQRKGIAVENETADRVRQRDAEILERDRLLNEQKHQAAEHRAVQAQIQQLIEMNALSDRGDVDFRFDTNGVIKSLMVTEELRRALVRGSLAVVGKNEAMSVVPTKVAQKINERDTSWLLLMNTSSDSIEDIDDEYAGYEVPDDLMW